MFRYIVMPWKLFPQRREGLKAHRPRATVKLHLEGLTERILPSTSAPIPLADVSVASSPAFPQVSPVMSQIGSPINQWGQLIATIQQDLLGVWKALGQEIAQEMSFVQQQLDHILGINPSGPNQSFGTPAPLPGSGPVSGTPVPVAGGGTILHPMLGELSVSITSTSGNPLEANGTVSNAGMGTSITASLTDGDGDQTFGKASLSPPADPTTWYATFNALPAGEYTFTVQVQFNDQTASQSKEVNLPNPPPPPPP